MKKYENVSDEIEELFAKIVDETTIPEFLKSEIKIRSCEKQKEMCKITKLNDLAQTFTDGTQLAVVINEKAFDMLPAEYQNIVLVECLSGISVNPENDAVSLIKGDFITYTGVLQKFGGESIIILKESIKSIFDKIKRDEDEAKALEKAAGGKKRGRRPNAQ